MRYSFNYLKNEENKSNSEKQSIKIEQELLKFYNEIIIIGNFDEKKIFFVLSDLF